MAAFQGATQGVWGQDCAGAHRRRRRPDRAEHHQDRARHRRRAKAGRTMMGAAVLIILFNASNWGTYGTKQTEFPTMEVCSKSLAEMKINNERQNSGVAVVA